MTQNMMNSHCGWLFLLLSLVAFGGGLQIAQDGKTDYVIVLPDAPAAVLQTAAKELSETLGKVTGAEFPIFETSAAPEGKPAFRIETRSEEPWKNDETAIIFEGKNITFTGQMPRGPLYAVFHFLENYVGVRWWTAEESTIPRIPNLTVSAMDYRYAPPLWIREAHYYDPNMFPLFAAHLKCNGHFHQIPEELGGHRWLIGWCHTFGQFLPAPVYFKDHPDWYGMVDGKRQIPYHYQMCLTNEEMKAELIKKALEMVRKHPEAGMISISQNDGGTPCQCPKCKAIDEEEGSPSGLMLRVCNEVAEAINKEFPGFLVGTIAYTYTRKPPRITRPSQNVVVRLSGIECNFAQSLEFGEDNRSFRDDVIQWSKIAPHLDIGNYLANFTNYMQPHPNYRNIGNDIRFFVKNHAIGIFEQGDTHCVTGDFTRMRAWVVGHLLWNPELDERQVMAEFLNGYYGKAGPYLMDYLDYLCDAVEEARKKNGYRLGIFNNDVSGWMDVNVLNHAMELYGKAEKAVEGEPVYAARVRRERLTLDQVCLRRLPAMIRQSRMDGTPIPLPVDDPAKMANEFVELTANTTYIREHGLFGDYGKGLRDTLLLALDENAKLPDFCKGIPANAWDILPVNSYILAGTGTWVDTVDDADALHGKAVRLKGNHEQWAIQRPFSIGGNDQGQKWRLVFWAKVEGNATTGKAMSYGVYDSENHKPVLEDSVPLSLLTEQKGNYVRIVSRPFSGKENLLLWFAPPKRPLDEVKYISIDAALLVRDDVDLVGK